MNVNFAANFKSVARMTVLSALIFSTLTPNIASANDFWNAEKTEMKREIQETSQRQNRDTGAAPSAENLAVAAGLAIAIWLYSSLKSEPTKQP